jgi:hypothetical protein
MDQSALLQRVEHIPLEPNPALLGHAQERAESIQNRIARPNHGLCWLDAADRQGRGHAESGAPRPLQPDPQTHEGGARIHDLATDREITSSPPSGEHPMHDGDPVSSRADLQHERPVGSRYLPTRPRAAAVLDGCQRAQFIFDAHVVVERQLEPVVGREPLDSRFGPQALPALRLRSQILRRERA